MALPVHYLIADDYEDMSRRAADAILAEVRRKPNLLLCAATGATPTQTYALLAEKARAEQDLFAQVRVVKLDEWGGLPAEHPGSCESYLRRHLLEPLRIDRTRYIGFDGGNADAKWEVLRVGNALDREGRIDLCVLGLGLNGHVGFNEPADYVRGGPHVAELSETSLSHPMILDARGAVTHGLSLGMADILQSRRIFLLVSGERKREAVTKLINGGIRTSYPASLLKLHGNATCIIDRAAWPGGVAPKLGEQLHRP